MIYFVIIYIFAITINRRIQPTEPTSDYGNGYITNEELNFEKAFFDELDDICSVLFAFNEGKDYAQGLNSDQEPQLEDNWDGLSQQHEGSPEWPRYVYDDGDFADIMYL